MGAQPDAETKMWTFADVETDARRCLEVLRTDGPLRISELRALAPSQFHIRTRLRWLELHGLAQTSGNGWWRAAS